MTWRALRWLDPGAVVLAADPRGVALDEGGTRTAGLEPVPAFPSTSADGPIALCDRGGVPVAMIESVAALDPASRAVLERALAEREFAPEVLAVTALAYVEGAYRWSVRTAAGDRTFTTRQPWDTLPVTRTCGGAIAIQGDDGVRYVIRDLGRLDPRSRRMLFPLT